MPVALLSAPPAYANDSSPSLAGKAILKSIRNARREQGRISSDDPRLINPSSPYPGMRSYVDPRSQAAPIGQGKDAESSLSLEPRDAWTYSVDPLDFRATLESDALRFGTRVDRAEVFMSDTDGDWKTVFDLQDMELRFGWSF